MQQNYAAVIELLDKYYDGLYYGDTALLRDVFHPKARYVTVSGGQLLQLDMASYFPIVEARTSPQQLGEPYGFQIDSLEFAGPATALRDSGRITDQHGQSAQPWVQYRQASSTPLTFWWPLTYTLAYLGK